MSGEIGTFHGLKIIENPALPYGQVLTGPGVIVVPELAQLQYWAMIQEQRQIGREYVDGLIADLREKLGL